MKHILLIEDDPVHRQLTKDLLSFQNYEVSTAANGKEALDLLETLNPDLILTDITLPDMMGTNLVRKLRVKPEFMDTPIIAVTAFTSVSEKQNIMDAGFTSYVSKPADIHYLMRKIRELLEG